MAGKGRQIVKTEERNLPLDRVRNIGIIAHIDAGKTTTTERILFYTGRTYKIGDIDEGTTQMDWMVQERERGITIVSAATTTFWTLVNGEAVGSGQYRINIIDTPGHVDFTAEVERSLRVLDGGVMVLDAEERVQAQTETVSRQADKYHVPRIIFVNKMDKIGADFEGTVGAVREQLGLSPVIVSYPIGAEHDFSGVVLVLERKALVWDKDATGETFRVTEIPDNLREKVEEIRSDVVEQISETDDGLLGKFLAGEEPSVVELKKALRQATCKGKLFPIFAGSSLRNKGVQPVLDGVVEYLPSPLDVSAVKGVDLAGVEITREPKADEPLSALAFKIQTDLHVGRLTYARIYSGKISGGMTIYNATQKKSERVGRILLMHANSREEVREAAAGEIVALVGLKDATTGDTLCDPNKPIVLESISFPEPVISLAIEPETRIDQEKLGQALAKLSDEDPTFKVKVDHETGQTIISGMGELHLEILADRMRREFGVNAKTGAPQVAYRETIKWTEKGEGKYIRQTGGRGQYGHCLLRLEPLGRGEGFEFKSEVKGGAIPAEFIGPIEKGVKEAMENGVLAGYPMVDMKVVVYDGTYHDVDSSEIAFKIAGSMAFQNGARRAGLVILEPIMKVEVTTPEEFMGDIIGDLSAKRAQIMGTASRRNVRIVSALVPLAELSGYVTRIRGLSQGRASAYMEPSHYEEVPGNIAEQLAAERTGGKREA